MSGIFRSRRKKPAAPVPPAVVFTVKVRDADTGEPIEAAGVILSLAQEGFTNTDGLISFTVPTNHAFGFSVAKDGVYEPYGSPAFVLTASHVEEARLRRLPAEQPQPPAAPARVHRIGTVHAEGRCFADGGEEAA